MSDTTWQSKFTERKCPTCGSIGFLTSPLGANRCSFCDGTEGGHPPTISDCADRIEELEVKLAKVTDVALRLYYGTGVVTVDMHATLAELTRGKID